MARQTWVYVNRPGGGVDVYTKGEEPQRDVVSQLGEGSLWGDRHYEGMVATDGTDISSRTKHRAYMKERGLTTVDDYRGVWKAAEAKRDAYRTEGKGGAVTREDVARAVARLER